MIMLIGFITIGCLVWVLATCMANESDAEKRRAFALSGQSFPQTFSDVREKIAPAA
ncbi:hypothetical protein [Petrachloros mirabilis]